MLMFAVLTTSVLQKYGYTIHCTVATKIAPQQERQGYTSDRRFQRCTALRFLLLAAPGRLRIAMDPKLSVRCSLAEHVG
jgi:hypothetical protein